MPDVEVDKESLRRLLLGLKELPPKVRTGVRRELRGVGDEVIAAQRAILDGPLPKGVAVTGTRRMVTKNQKTGKWRSRALNVYGDTDVKNGGRSSGLREAIKAGLRTRIVVGKKRQGIDIRTTGAKDAAGFNRARFWQAKRFRHPVFGNKSNYVYQAGQPYFFAPAIAGRDAMVRRAAEILGDAVKD